MLWQSQGQLVALVVGALMTDMDQVVVQALAVVLVQVVAGVDVLSHGLALGKMPQVTVVAA